jgi:hypothetical protein
MPSYLGLDIPFAAMLALTRARYLIDLAESTLTSPSDNSEYCSSSSEEEFGRSTTDKSTEEQPNPSIGIFFYGARSILYPVSYDISQQCYT